MARVVSRKERSTEQLVEDDAENVRAILAHEKPRANFDEIVAAREAERLAALAAMRTDDHTEALKYNRKYDNRKRVLRDALQ